MDKEYVSILEFSKMANVTKQAVYQRLDKDLAAYCMEIDGRKCISIDALSFVGKSVKSSGESTVKRESSQDESVSQIDGEVELKIDLLASQLEEKDKLLQKQQDLIYSQQEQLRKLQDHIMIQSTEMVKLLSKNTQLQENYQVLFDRIQKRESIDNVIEYGESQVESIVGQEVNQVDNQESKPIENVVEGRKIEEKKSFWKRLFG